VLNDSSLDIKTLFFLAGSFLNFASIEAALDLDRGQLKKTRDTGLRERVYFAALLLKLCSCTLLDISVVIPQYKLSSEHFTT